jgi:protein-disulfide isomerase
MKVQHGRILETVATSCVIAASLAVMWTVFLMRQGSMGTSLSGLDKGNSKPIEDVSSLSLTVDLNKAAAVRTHASKVVMVEFSDFQCPFCGKYTRESLPLINREFVDNGRMSYAFFDFPLKAIHGDATRASMAARCAGRKDDYWRMHDVLFSRHGRLDADSLAESWHSLGLDDDKFRTCISNGDDKVEQSIAVGERIGVRSTPEFFIGELGLGDTVLIHWRISGAQPMEVFREALSRAVDKHKAALARPHTDQEVVSKVNSVTQ